MRRHTSAPLHLFAVMFCGVCSACQLFDPSIRELASKLDRQDMVIDPFSDQHARGSGDGFAITMKPEVARRVNAPEGAEFKEMLKRQLAVEHSHGHDYCPNGYEGVRTIYYKHWYTEIWVNCK